MASMLDITVEVATDDIMFEKFINLIENKTGELHSREVAIHAGLLHDAIYLYAMGLDTVLGHGGTVQNGSMIIDALINTSFSGMTGKVIIDTNGTRKANYHLHNIQNSHYVTIAVSNGSMGGMSHYHGADIVWPGGKLITPLGRPVCGWKGEMCLGQDNSVTIIVTTVILFCVLVAFFLTVSIKMYRKKQRQGRLSSMSWKIAFESLNTSVDRRLHKTRSSRFMSRDTLKTVAMESFPSLNIMRASMESDSSGGDQLFAKIAIYDGTAVAVKMVRKNYLAITPEVVTEINQIIHLKHNNINPLMGACVDPFKVCLVSEYCNRGSLQDVLENDDIKLDRIFKLSFAHDIARGMAYLHQSPVKTHGQLKSSNVLIDGHWVCKITDIAMPKFREGERSSSRGQHAQFYSKLWTAPELLRAPCEYATGTPKGDVYSYAIILQEIILRTGPYGYINEDPEDIISRVKVLEHPPYRPKVPQDAGEETLLDLMRICWEEIPMFRPNFINVVETLRNANNGKTTNLVDQMIHMMEKYADHLEDLVNERTKRLEEEQQRTDELLCRMLPKSIASDLKMGKRVVPETFECVTIFFSDIVGFTVLSSESTAMEVVDFLNDLYISFDTIIENYDVYKVETIGDAYMVVSGLPVKNGKRHAGEVCTMALDLLSCVTTFRIRHRPHKQLQLRIGIHSGPVAAGVVGLKMPRFCLFGDTVNYASRMESCGLALRIHISPECKCILDELGGFSTKCRGDISVKGKGTIRTYFLLTKEGFDKPLPDLRLAASLEEHEFK
ncbi:hypothetical protein ACJMK2_022266 [Sinanodonta woodiana]|uniref:Guanylate cyclase n=1 Tax=Sinanodonta woodiana TaxID=1069815 RepID=A0ABD3TIN4_SINWO